jgi:DNA-binding transcriptional MerR regulator
VSARSYLSIGDVLTLLRQEFPDITISKIRFLESQGLVNPERTPSGYRKFYEPDVERLRWVLRQQREHFLPLKVIKDRLDDGSEGSERADRTEGAIGSNGNEVEVSVEEAGAPTPAAGVSREAIDARVHGADPARDSPAHVEADQAEPDQVTGVDGPAAPTRTAQPDRTESVDTGRRRQADPVLVGQAASRRAPGRPASESPATANEGRGLPGIEDPSEPPPSSSARSTSPGEGPPDGPARSSASTRSSRSSRRAGPSGETPDPAQPAAARAEPVPEGPSEPPTTSSGGGASPSSTRPAAPEGRPVDLTGASLTMAELATASGLSEEVLAQLREYGLLAATQVGGVEYFDEDCLAIANLAAGFARYGVEPRHLRLYKNTADREAGFIEQIVLPLVRQRNPEARQRAGRTADELTQLGQGLRSALLRGAIRDLLGG